MTQAMSRTESKNLKIFSHQLAFLMLGFIKLIIYVPIANMTMANYNDHKKRNLK